MKQRAAALITVIRTWIAAGQSKEPSTLRVGRCYIAASIGSLALVASAFTVAQPAQTQSATYRFDLPVQSLADSLRAIGRQTSKNILFAPALVEGISAPALRADLTLTQAVNQLLSGTKLSAENVPPDTLLIKSDAASSSTRDASTPLSMLEEGRSNGRTGTHAYTRLAQAESVSPQSESSTVSTASSEGSTQSRIELEEIVVTGTHIRGAAPVGSPLIVIDRAEIQASGHGRVQDIMAALPQNYSGAVNEYTGNDPGAANWNLGQAVDLRGLGASSTLVLVNGRRQAAGGTEGSFIDISSIPSAAVERVEILADGASALYGSDAIGGVVNFVLRKDFEGAQTSARFATAEGAADEKQFSQLFGGRWSGGHALLGYQYYHRDYLPADEGYYSSFGGDYRALGGRDNRLQFAAPGNILNPTTNQPAFAIPRGQNGRALTTAMLLPGVMNFQDRISGVAWLPEHTQHSGFLFVSQSLGERFEVFADARHGRREMENPVVSIFSTVRVPSTNPFYFNPFGGTAPLSVAYEFRNDLGNRLQVGQTDTFAGTAGLSAQIRDGWEAELTGTFSRERNDFASLNELSSAALTTALADTSRATAFNPFGDGSFNNPATVEAIRATILREALSKSRSLAVLINGSLFDLPGGAVKLAFGADSRREELDAERGTLANATGVFTRSGASIGAMTRDIDALFAELTLPVFSGVDLSLAARFEDYSDFGETFNPKVGISWAPFQSLLLRGSWGTSFRAPRLNELNPNVNPPSASITANAIDPLSTTGRSNVLALNGFSGELHEETADVFSFGVDWQPEFARGLRTSLTYFGIDYEDKVDTPPSGSSILGVESIWAEVIIRNPTQAQIDEVCSRSDLTGTTFSTCRTTPFGAIVDRRTRNVGGLKVNGFDLDVSKTFQVFGGALGLNGNATYILKFEQATSSTAPFVDFLDTVGKPKQLRGRVAGTWTQGGFAATAIVSYVDRSKDLANNRPVGSWTTTDVTLSRELPDSQILGAGVRLSLSAVNVFDKLPPFADTFNGFDTVLGNDLGRVIGATVSKDW